MIAGFALLRLAGHPENTNGDAHDDRLPPQAPFPQLLQGCLRTPACFSTGRRDRRSLPGYHRGPPPTRERRREGLTRRPPPLRSFRPPPGGRRRPRRGTRTASRAPSRGGHEGGRAAGAHGPRLGPGVGCYETDLSDLCRAEALPKTRSKRGASAPMSNNVSFTSKTHIRAKMPPVRVRGASIPRESRTVIDRRPARVAVMVQIRP